MTAFCRTDVGLSGFSSTFFIIWGKKDTERTVVGCMVCAYTEVSLALLAVRWYNTKKKGGEIGVIDP